MPIQVTCEKCATDYRLPEKAAGKRIRCKSCQSVITVPSATNDDFLTDLALEDFRDGAPPPQPAKPRKKKKKKRKRKWEPNLPAWAENNARVRIRLLMLLVTSPFFFGFGVYQMLFEGNPGSFKSGSIFAGIGGVVMLYAVYVFRGKQ